MAYYSYIELDVLLKHKCIESDIAVFLSNHGYDYNNSSSHEDKDLNQQIAITETWLTMVEKAYQRSINLLTGMCTNGMFTNVISHDYACKYDATTRKCHNHPMQTMVSSGIQRLDKSYFQTTVELRRRLSELQHRLEQNKKEEEGRESLKSQDVATGESTKQSQSVCECEEEIKEAAQESVTKVPDVTPQESRKNHQPISSAVLESIACMDNLSPCEDNDVGARIVHLDSQMEMVENMYKRSTAFVCRPGLSIKLEKSYYEAKLKIRKEKHEYQKKVAGKEDDKSKRSVVLETIEFMTEILPYLTTATGHPYQYESPQIQLLYWNRKMEMVESMYKQSTTYINEQNYPTPVDHRLKLEKAYDAAKVRIEVPMMHCKNAIQKFVK